MGRSGLEEPDLETCEPRFGAAAGRWFVESGVDGSQSSGRLSSSFDLRAERTDDGVLVAPLAEGAERIVWVADMRLEPGAWPRRGGVPTVRLSGGHRGSPELEIHWRGLPGGAHALHFTVLCRPEGRLTFENAAFDPTVQVASGSGSTSLGLRPYRSLPPLEVEISAPARLEGGPHWSRGVRVVEAGGGVAAEDRFSPGRVLVEDPGGELRVRVKVLRDEDVRPARDGVSRAPAWIARPEWAASVSDAAGGGLAEQLGRAAADPSASPDRILEDLAERASGGALWAGLEGLPRWDERAPSGGPIAVEHAAQLVALMRRRARSTPSAVRAADRASRWFRDRFWLSTPRRLADRALRARGGRPSGLSLRPHMLIAAALAEAPLRRSERRAMFDLAASRLLTPHGLRSLDPEDLDFDGEEGGRGAIWPWLVAPFSATAVLAGGVDRHRLRRLVALALACASGPEAWTGSADEGPVRPAGRLVFSPNRCASDMALRWLSGVTPDRS